MMTISKTQLMSNPFVLFSYVELELNTPDLFSTFEEAQKAMYNQVAQALGYESFEDWLKDNPDGDDELYLRDDYAYCENRNHDNCVWQIAEITNIDG